jgi:hypothetical protein
VAYRNISLALLKAIEQILVFFPLSRDQAAWFADQSESSQANRSLSNERGTTQCLASNLGATPSFLRQSIWSAARRTRHVFCTRLSEVAPDAVVQRAMRHTSPETKRRYQLGSRPKLVHPVQQIHPLCSLRMRQDAQLT